MSFLHHKEIYKPFFSTLFFILFAFIGIDCNWWYSDLSLIWAFRIEMRDLYVDCNFVIMPLSLEVSTQHPPFYFLTPTILKKDIFHRQHFFCHLFVLETMILFIDNFVSHIYFICVSNLSNNSRIVHNNMDFIVGCTVFSFRSPNWLYGLFPFII